MIQFVCEKRHDKGQPDFFHPVVICDVCKKRIFLATDGNAFWLPNFEGDKDTFYATGWPVCFAHKACDAAVPVGHYSVAGLDEFVAFLGRSLGMELPSKLADAYGM